MMMKIFTPGLVAAFLLGVAVVSACGAADTRPPASEPAPAQGEARVPPSTPLLDPDAGRSAHTAADVRFMQGMIVHHQQALEMASLVPDRSERPDVRLLARRIEASQDDEIALMGAWLQRRGEEVPEVDGVAHAGGHGAHPGHDAMHGMLTPAELTRLAAARGDEFDRLFLSAMIRHHQGALQMVAELFASDGAAQETEIFNFASHVDSDQRIEIARMTRMLQER
jgi:uncharacterized protein (DUF305 family)